jgi:multidrug efflux pump subunit AcrB
LELLGDLTLPQNASIYATDTVARRFDAALEGDPDVARWSTYVGRGAIRSYLPLNVQLPNDFFAQAMIVAKACRTHVIGLLERWPRSPSIPRVSPGHLGRFSWIAPERGPALP